MPMGVYPRRPWQERFWDHVDSTGECWLWTGGKYSNGYGTFHPKKLRNALAHRVSWELAYGPVPEGLLVCHRCDVRACVRPEHLFLGNTQDNIRDMWAKGRQKITHHRGERNGQSKLTEGQVVEIRTRYAAGGETHASLAAEYGVSRALIYTVCYRKGWKHVA